MGGKRDPGVGLIRSQIWALALTNCVSLSFLIQKWNDSTCLARLARKLHWLTHRKFLAHSRPSINISVLLPLEGAFEVIWLTPSLAGLATGFTSEPFSESRGRKWGEPWAGGV